MSTKSIWDTRFTPPKVALDADVEAAFLALDDLDIAEDEWKTIKGAKVLLDDDTGEILGGMGGKFHGQTLKDVTGKKQKLPAQRYTYSGSAASSYRRMANQAKKRGDFESAERYQKEARRAAEEEKEEIKKGMAYEAKIQKERMNRDWKADPPASVDFEFLTQNLGGRDIDVVAFGFEHGVMPEVLRETKGSMLLKFDGAKAGYPDNDVEMWVPKGKILNQKEAPYHGQGDHEWRTGHIWSGSEYKKEGQYRIYDRHAQKRDLNLVNKRRSEASMKKFMETGEW